MMDCDVAPLALIMCDPRAAGIADPGYNNLLAHDKRWTFSDASAQQAFHSGSC
jgi:hypothetical protein